MANFIEKLVATKQASQDITKQILEASKSGNIDAATTQMLLLNADGSLSNKDRRVMKQLNRQMGRTDRTALRSDARKVAYANGINPIAGVIGAVAQVGNSAANIIGATTGVGTVLGGISEEVPYYGNSSNSQQTADPRQTTVPDQVLPDMGGGSNKTIILIVAAIAALFLLKK